MTTVAVGWWSAAVEQISVCVTGIRASGAATATAEDGAGSKTSLLPNSVNPNFPDHDQS
jgi:hypothetical protein